MTWTAGEWKCGDEEGGAGGVQTQARSKGSGEDAAASAAYCGFYFRMEQTWASGLRMSTLHFLLGYV